MKKLLVILFVCLFQTASAITYYFSDISGDDSRTSTEAQNPATPWKTLSKLNAFFKSLNPGDSVLFKRGETFYGSINVTKSGSLTSPIVLSAYGIGSKPVIEGFTILSNWVSLNNGIYESYNPSLGTSVNMVLLNGIQQAMGRYPNSDAPKKGYLTFESHNTNVSITDNDLPATPNWTNAELVIRSVHWSIERRKIISHTGGTLSYVPLQYTPADRFGYFIQNDIKTLDQPGEWYYDPSVKKMYMYFGANSPDLYTIKASSVDTLFNMYNLDNIVIDGIAFEGANKRAINFYSVDVGVTSVKNCDIRFSGIDGLVTGTSKNMIIDNNTITDVNNFGVFLSASGWYTLTNNIVKRVSLFIGLGTTGSNNSIAIRVNGQNSLIQGNIVDSVGFTGIWFVGDSVLIKNNFVQHYCKNLDDGGGINTGSQTTAPSFGRRITHNVVLNGFAPLEGTTSTTVGATNGIYIDDNSSGVVVDSNTTANNNFNGILFHNVFSSSIYGNTVYNSDGSQLRLIHNTPKSKLRDIVINNNIFVAKTPAQFTFYAQTDTSDAIFNTWGSIDSNYHCRPLLQTTVIKTIQPNNNQNLTIADWYALSSFDQHSFISPKTFSSAINPDDSIRFEYNATNSVKTINLDKAYIDVKKNQYSGAVDIQPFSSLILMPPPIAPTVSITSPADNAGFIPPANITITAIAADADGTISKVEFYNSNNLLGTTNTSPYTFTWTNVASGNYAITAKATDNDSVVTISSIVNISVNQPPSISIINPANNTNFSAPASITIDAPATDVDGTISKVEFYNGGTLIGTVTTSPYTFTWTNIYSGNYTITAKATDNGSLVTTSSPVNIFVNQPPTINITNPANNASYASPATISITANAIDADGTISKVEFYNGSTLLSTVTTSPYSFTWANVPPGNYAITAKATDNGSLTTTSSIINIIVNSAPTVSISSPVNSSTFASPANITINATAADADGTISEVDFYNDDILLSTDNTSPYSITWSNVTPGSYSLTAKATDNGNLVTTSPAVIVSVYTPNIPPTVTIASPASNASFSAPATFTINATAADADGIVTKVDYYNGSTLLGTVNASPYSFTWNNVPSGTYTITAIATDNGLLSTTSSAVTISVNQVPAVSITSPVNNATFTAPANITFTATATDADGTISKVDFYNGSTLLSTDNTSTYSYSWTNVPAGAYTLTAKATDNGSLITTSLPVAISVSASNIPPTVSITAPANNAVFPSPAIIIINSSAADADGTVSKVDFYNGSTLLGTDNTSPYSFTWTNVPTGAYTLTIKATDNGSSVTTSTAVAVSVNSAPTVTLTSPVNNAKYNAPASVTIKATATDVGGSVSKVDFYNGSTLLGTDNTSPYSVTWSSIPAGNYSITAKATDNTFLVTTSAAIAISVNAAPTVSISSPLNNTVFASSATITIYATAADADGTITKVAFYKGTTLLGTDSTSPYSYTWTKVAAGSYSLTAKATDNGSLVSTSAAVAVSVNAAPTVSITSPANNAKYNAPASVVINATAADAGGSVSKVDFYNGSTLLGSDNTDPYSFTWSNVPSGIYSLTAKATDNTSLLTISSAIAIVVSGPPAVSLMSPVNSAVFAPPATIIFNATATDADGSVTKVDFYNGSTKLNTDITSPYSYTWKNVASGNYTLTAKATDNSSLVTTSAAINISVNTPPTVSISSPTNNASYSAPANITLVATAADPGGLISKVDFYNGTNLLGTSSTSPYSFSWNNVPIGTYTVTAKATDNLGLSITSAPITVLVTQSLTYTPKVINSLSAAVTFIY